MHTNTLQIIKTQIKEQSNCWGYLYNQNTVKYMFFAYPKQMRSSYHKKKKSKNKLTEHNIGAAI